MAHNTTPAQSQRPAKPQLDYKRAAQLLAESFALAEDDLMKRSPVEVEPWIANACDVLFRSSTQAYREVLLGCTVARILDRNIEIRRPYVEREGEDRT